MPRQRGASPSPLPAASALIEGRDWDLAVQAEAETELSGGNRERGHCLVDGGPLNKQGWQGECGWWWWWRPFNLKSVGIQGDSGGLTAGLG